jgi:hypothetical protein
MPYASQPPICNTQKSVARLYFRGSMPGTDERYDGRLMLTNGLAR